MIALDTETTGMDFWHGARPYLVTTCSDGGDLRFWEWDVDPRTREVLMPDADRAEVQAVLDLARGWATMPDEEMRERHVLVGQNLKFDAHALHAAGIGPWPWEVTRDILVGGHLLASNQPHDLTSMALQYCEIDIEPFEKRLHFCVEKARRYARRHHADWAIAREGRPDMPSMKEKGWKIDAWVPRALARFYGWPEPDPACDHLRDDGKSAFNDDDHLCGLCGGHEYWIVTSRYANGDSAATMAVWLAQRSAIAGQDLWAHYMHRMRLVPVLWRMEERGPWAHAGRHAALRRQYRQESAEAADRLVGIAASEGYDLKLPKGNRNDSLTRFCFGYAVNKCDVCGAEMTVGREQVPRLRQHQDRGDPCRRCTEAGVAKPGRPTVVEYPCLDLPVLRRSDDTGAPSMDKEVMRDYLTSELQPGTVQYAFVEALAAKRKRDMSLQFLDSYERFWLPANGGRDRAECEDRERAAALARLGNLAGPTAAPPTRDEWSAGQDPWRVLHPSLNPTGTDTLRLSCQNPNAQQVDKHPDNRGASLRSVFGPGPGREWWAVDFENLELRIPAFKAGEQELMDVFLHPDKAPYFGSYHLVIFHLLHPALFEKHGAEVKDIPEYKATLYQWVKNGNFAVLYGAMERKADATYHVPGAYKRIRHRFPKMAALSDRMVAFANKHGYVNTFATDLINPRRGYPLMVARSSYGHQQGVEPTKPLNYAVQGTACESANLAAVMCDDQLGEWRAGGFDAYIPLYVHDELVFDFPKGGRRNLPKVRRLVSIMESVGEGIGVPLKAAAKYCPEHWGKSEEPK